MNNNNISGRRDGRDAVCSNCPVNSNPDVRQSPRRRPLSPDENQSGHQPSQSSLSGGGTRVLGDSNTTFQGIKCILPMPWFDTLNAYNKDPDAGNPIQQSERRPIAEEECISSDDEVDSDSDPDVARPIPQEDMLSFNNKDDTEEISHSDSSDSPQNSSEQEETGSRTSSPIPEGEYEVEDIADFVDGLYEVKWKGYSVEDNTWEPVTSLHGCNDKLFEFYLKRKRERESANSQKGRKKLKLEVPPDPRTLEVILQEYFDKNDSHPSDEDVLSKHQLIEKGGWKKRWSEEKMRKFVEQAMNGKLTETQTEELLYQATFFLAQIASQKMQAALKEWTSMVNGISKGCPIISIENKIDLAHPPTDFTYINSYIAAEGIEIPQDPPTGCSCDSDCRGCPSTCCPKMAGEYQKGGYYKKGLVKAPLGTPIYECNNRCTCTSKCRNRVVQDGVSPLRGKKLCVFKTPNCGWGVRTEKRIRKGAYVCLYAGEVITDEMANTRGKTYDQEGSTYLFDLDFNETDLDNCPYVIDAKMYGNISHFFNHSCDPNLCVYGVWCNCLDPNLPMLALFACKDIPEGTELTFNYKSSQQATKKAENRDDLDAGSSLPLIKQTLCHCGSDNCRIYLF
ncbi:histone-lysine N-methyltransferase SUV39H2 isoform X1 [Folsomia candida]|uniref:histone-lysine N-methyltransferase SUV39H2 isoform X1 n=2 Tax=Folsomia candida TaxID=158441 RepID=UPI000B8EF054|nr:histone-lysine N-methyltransferase SUV39H2 isoform X1 [Folsomia candida]XP_021953906.1 histone-lysine N-methyltransferase SUV39H2 isoform X1 [Folsomia candida]XP_021953907.1 histone-lysine N-methyltransferase SUV39H2 isoform X1 [Folsomia candida]